MIACSLALSLALAAAPHLRPQGVQSGLDLRSLAVRAADANRDGAVEADEWSAFVDSLAADSEGRLDRERVRSWILRYDWDFDRDGTATGKDLRTAFASLDADGDGKLRTQEIGAAPGGYFGVMAYAILLHAADAQGDGEVGAEEWEVVASATGESDSLDPVAVAGWLKRVQAEPPPADVNAVSPGVYLLTLSSALDADFDGKITLTDVQLLFAGFDASGDGRVDSAELAPRRAGRPAVPSPAEEPPTPFEPDARRPPQIPWQRNLDDALALVRRTGKPLLVCVNADGESASEVIARGRYRDPEFAALVRGFVPLLLCPFPHTTREHDDSGRRIPDPRFGRVLDSEHIAPDDSITARYFAGERVAPRHAAFDAEGKTIFDIYLVTDLGTIDRALRQHGVFDVELPDPATLSETELLDSPDAACRDHLEELFAHGDLDTRTRLAGTCLAPQRATQHPEILRMALLDESAAVRASGVTAFVGNPAAAPAELLLSTLEAAREERGLQESVLAALHELSASAPDSELGKRAERIMRVFAALERRSQVVDAERWKLALSFAPLQREVEPAVDQKDAVLARIDDLEKRIKSTPEDRQLQLLFADALMRLARIQWIEGGNPSYLFEDVRHAARLATSDERPDGRALGYLAWSSYLLSEEDAADLAARALPLLSTEPGSPLAAQVLDIFAKGRSSALNVALDDGSWKDEWIPDLCSAYEVMLAHPSLTESRILDYVRFLGSIEAHARQAEVVRRGLALFPASTELHASFRKGVLRDGGARALEAAYESLPRAPEQEASFAWFAGLATLVAAERHVGNQHREPALEAYRLSVERFRESVALEPSFRGSAFHYIALALAGTASLLVEEAHLDDALAAIREGIATSPNSSATADGLGNTPAATAKRIHRELVRSGRSSEASALRDELDTHGVSIGS